MSDEPWIDPARWADAVPHVKACDDAVRDAVRDLVSRAVGPDIPVYVYDPKLEPPSPFEEGVASGYMVVWTGGAGPGLLRKVEVLVDEDGVVVVEPTGDWQDTTVVDDREEKL